MHARWSWLAVGMGLLVLIVALCQYARSTLTVRLAVRRDPALVPILTSAPAQRQLARATGPDKAFRWRRLRWRDENGRIAEGALRTALAQREANIAFWAGRRLTAGIDRSHWAHRGPNNVGGRTRSLIIDPKNADRMWAGSVSGGIWYSSDRGTSWAPVNDWLPNLAVCCLAIDPRNPQFMYAGTGEGFFNGDALGGAGIYKSTDGGSTWSQLPATANWDNVNRLAVSPADLGPRVFLRRL
jgi:photosystem II stability/assembly factor-like uncharacterized protein